MKPLLSIAIPTHNRSRYAIHAIRSLLAISDARLEVVVSDTSTDGKLCSLISEDGAAQDPRLKYIRPAHPLDMTGNHNAAIEHCSGEFVCLIGDDDTITQDALKAAEWAKESCVDIVAPNVVSNYAWDDFRSRYFGAKHASRLYLPSRIGGARVCSSDRAISLALNNAGQGTDGLPKIYHGIVKRSVLEDIRASSGAFFHGSSPDVSGAVGLALRSKRFLVVDFPLTIPGASGGSNTGRSALNQHKGKLENEVQTQAFGNQGWSPGVPRFFSVETVWAHAAVETIRRLAPERLAEFNFPRLIGICNALHPEYAAEIERAASEAREIYGIHDFARRERAERWSYRAARMRHFIQRVSRPTAAGGRKYADKVATIAEAPLLLASHMRRNEWEWEKVIEYVEAA